MSEPMVPGSERPVPEGEGASLALELRREDLERELSSARRKERWHFVWAILGLSPAAAIPALGLLIEGNGGLLVLLGFLVMVTEGIAWARAGVKARALERELQQLGEEERSG